MVQDIVGNNMTYDIQANIVENSISINKDGTVLGENTPPVADAGGPYSGNVNESIAFDGSGSYDAEGGLLYFWEFGDGNSSTQTNPSHSYVSAGTFDVTLTVTDDGGLMDMDSTVVITSSSTGSLAITNISPNGMSKGQTDNMMISGTGFEQNTIIEFSGEKFSPMINSINVIDSKTIEINITTSTAGPKKDFVYAVTATNSNGDSFTLPASFTVFN